MKKISMYSAAFAMTSAAIFTTLSCSADTLPAAPTANLTPKECGVDVRPQDLPNGDYGGFYTWPEIVSEINGWITKYPNLVSIHKLGTSTEGRPIPLLKISNHPNQDEDKPEVLFVVGIHPREQAPTVAIVRFVNELLSQYGKDDEITKLVDSRELWVVPMLNVDGKIYDFQHGNGTTKGGDWRKNRRPNADGTFGVDLNRNFPARWGGNRSIDKGWGTSTADTRGNIYEGPAPASEPEVRAVMDFVSTHPLRIMLDLHSPLHEILTPGYLSASDQPIYLDLLQKMGKTQKSPYPMPVAKPGAEPPTETRGGDSGISYPWSYYTTGAYALNIEMGYKAVTADRYTIGLSARYANAATVETEYTDNIRGPLMTLLREAGNLKLATPGNAKLTESRWEGTPKAGEKVVWKPQIQGTYEYAVAISNNAAGVITREFRLHPDQDGFTVNIQPDAKAGTHIPLDLYIWNGRQRSAFHQDLIVQ